MHVRIPYSDRVQHRRTLIQHLFQQQQQIKKIIMLWTSVPKVPRISFCQKKKPRKKEDCQEHNRAQARGLLFAPNPILPEFF